MCSLPKKIVDINFLVNKYQLDILSINETHLDSTINDFELNISVFSLYPNDRNRHGGGMAIYIPDEIKHKLRSDLFVVGLESVWVEITTDDGSSYLLCSMYRPPSSRNDYYDMMIENIELASVTCLHRVVDDLCENIDDGDLCGVCFLDIKKYFDSINHKILLQKLKYYGIDTILLKWFQYYLHGR